MEKIRELVAEGKYELSKHALPSNNYRERRLVAMARVYHRCHFCRGEVEERRITVDNRWGEQLVAVIENVPAGVCQVCGEQYFKAEVVKEMEKLACSNEKPRKTLEIPLRELTVV